MITEENVACVPKELASLDENADAHWPILLKRSGVLIGKHRVNHDRLYMLNNLGLPDLLFRLECQSLREHRSGLGYDHVARAGIWLHVTEAMSEGRDIGDISSDTLWRLNSFLPAAMRFSSPALERARLKALENARAGKSCANERCKNGPGGMRSAAARARSRYCSKACRNSASRGYSPRLLVRSAKNESAVV